jgi:tight adherence protein B
MSPATITLLTFGATALLVGGLVSSVHDVFFRYRLLVKDRLDELSGKGKADVQASLFNDLKQMSAAVASTRSSWRAALRDIVEQSGLRIQPRVLLGVSAGLGAALGVVAVILARRWWAAPAGLAPGLVAPTLYVCMKRRLRMRKLIMQLPETFDLIGRAVRAGQTVPAAFQLVADDLQPPICEEFQRCYEQQNLGMSFDAALRNLARRTGIMEMRILAIALLVQARTGGNLHELLNNLATMVRTRIKLQQKVKALTGEGRLQARILIVLPVLAFASLLVISPHYAATLLERPELLAGTMAAQLIGAVWIRRIVNFDF